MGQAVRHLDQAVRHLEEDLAKRVEAVGGVEALGLGRNTLAGTVETVVEAVGQRVDAVVEAVGQGAQGVHSIGTWLLKVIIVAGMCRSGVGRVVSQYGLICGLLEGDCCD